MSTFQRLTLRIAAGRPFSVFQSGPVVRLTEAIVRRAFLVGTEHTLAAAFTSSPLADSTSLANQGQSMLGR